MVFILVDMRKYSENTNVQGKREPSPSSPHFPLNQELAGKAGLIRWYLELRVLS